MPFPRRARLSVISARNFHPRGRPKSNQRQPSGGPPSINTRASVLPPQQTAHDHSDHGCDKAVPSLISGDDLGRLIQIEKPTRGHEPARSYHNYGVWRRPDVGQPLGVRTEAADYDGFRPVIPILHDFEHSLVAAPTAPPDMDQKQEPAPQKPAALPSVQIRGRLQRPPQASFHDTPCSAAHLRHTSLSLPETMQSR